jgi:pentatricopeptide repeat protein
MYAVVGDYEWRTVTKRLRDGRPATSEFTIPLTEVSAPPPSIVGVGLTWDSIVSGYGDWGELLDTFATWQEMAS